MCGIAGIIPAQSNSTNGSLIRGFLRALQHRGPDDYGYLSFSAGTIRRQREVLDGRYEGPILAHRRLSILDLSSAGWQPMSSPDGRYHIVFNGEIYNYRELKQELQGLGCCIRSESDTEVLLAAYGTWGPEALNRLTGMYAFAILDCSERSVFLARDCFGIKPLYWTEVEGGIAFASQIRPLLDCPGVDRAVNPGRLFQYLRFGITDHGSETMFRSIRQLPAAHYMRISIDHPQPETPHRYWQLDPDARSELSFDQSAERLRELFLKSVQLHLRSDVPVGSALSGGIDSSAIVMAMRHLDPGREIHAFSYVAQGTAKCEEAWIDIVSSAAGVTSHKVNPTADELVRDVEHLLLMQDEPFGSTSLYAQYSVFRSAREQQIPVLLDGQGADELLAGYTPYIAARVVSLLQQKRYTSAIRLVNRASSNTGIRKRWLAQIVAEYLLPDAVQHPLRRLVGKEVTPTWMNVPWFVERDASGYRPKRPASGSTFRNALQRSLTETQLPGLLRYEDRNSMAFSIESRVPFLTTELAEFMSSLPEEYLISQDGTTKAVFRKAMRGIVPDPILDRQDKVGFETPERAWLTSLRPWVTDVLERAQELDVAALNLQSLGTAWQEIEKGERHFDYWSVWRLVNVIEWSRLFHVTYN